MLLYFTRSFTIVGLFFALNLASAQSEQQIQTALEELAETMNLEGPQQLGPNLRLDNVIALPAKHSIGDILFWSENLESIGDKYKRTNCGCATWPSLPLTWKSSGSGV